MGSGLDVKIFLLLQAAGVEQGVASSGWCFLPPLVQSLSDRFLREAPNTPSNRFLREATGSFEVLSCGGYSHFEARSK